MTKNQNFLSFYFTKKLVICGSYLDHAFMIHSVSNYVSLEVRDMQMDTDYLNIVSI